MITPMSPNRRQSRRERRESKRATRRLRRFRADEVQRLRADALRFTLSEAVVMASLRREAAAIAEDITPAGTPAVRSIKRLHSWEGQMKAVESHGWLWFVQDDCVHAYVNEQNGKRTGIFRR